MKTSMIIIVALFLNTTLLIAEPLSAFVQGVNPFLLLGIEAILVLGFFTNKWLKDLDSVYTLELDCLNIFVVKSDK